MRVGLVAYPLASQGGVFRWANVTAELLSGQGHEAHLIVGSRPDPRAWRGWSWTHKVQAIHAMPAATRWPSLESARSLVRLVEGLSLDVLIAVQWYSVAVSLLAPLRPTRLVVVVQGALPPALKGLAYRAVVGLLIKRADAVVAVAEHLFSSIPALLRCKKGKVIPNSVRRIDRSSTSKLPGLLYVGRLEPEKGIRDLVWMMRRVRDIRLTVAGNGCLTDEVRAAAQNLPHVSYLGWVEDPAELYRSHRYLVMPSHTEGCPHVLVEAIAHGAIPIIRDLPIARELEVPPAWRFTSIDEVPGIIGDLERSEPARVEREHARLQERVTSRFDPAVVYAQWAELLDSVAPGR